MDKNFAAEQLVAAVKDKLDDGLMATDVWEKGQPVSLAGYNSQEAATKLFDTFNEYIERSLKESRFPPLGRYFLIELDGDKAVVILNYGELLQGMLVNLYKANMGKVVSLAIPSLFRTWGKVSM